MRRLHKFVFVMPDSYIEYLYQLKQMVYINRAYKITINYLSYWLPRLKHSKIMSYKDFYTQVETILLDIPDIITTMNQFDDRLPTCTLTEYKKTFYSKQIKPFPTKK
jgi:hypothetical protein